MIMWLVRRLDNRNLFAGFKWTDAKRGMLAQWVNPVADSFSPLVFREQDTETLTDLHEMGINAVWVQVTING